MLTKPDIHDRRVLAEVWDTNLRSRGALYLKLLAGKATKLDRAHLRQLERKHHWLLRQAEGRQS